MQIEIPIYYDAWMDNGIENLYKILAYIENSNKSVKISLDKERFVFDIKNKIQFLKQLETRIKQKRNQVIFSEVKDKKTGQKKKRQKPFILQQFYLNQEDYLYKDEKILLRLNEIFNIGNKNENKFCLLCGNKFKRNVDKLKQGVYPLVTKIKSLSGIRTMKDSYNEICPICYLVGVLEWVDEAIVYRSYFGGGKKSYSVVFLPYMKDLQMLSQFKTRYLTNLDLTNKDLRSNLKIRIITKEGKEKNIPQEGEYTTLLYFFEKFFTNIYFQEKRGRPSWLDYSKIKEELCREWILLAIPSGSIKNIKHEKLNIVDNILEVTYLLTIDGFLIYSSFLSKIYFKSKKPLKGFEIVSEIREKMAKNIMKNDFSLFSRSFLPKSNGYVYFSREVEYILSRLIYLWRWKYMGFNDKHLNMLKSAGRTVAMISENRISLLYRLDKARDGSQLLDAIRQVSRRIAGMKEEEKEEYRKRGFFYPPAIEELVELVERNEDKKLFQDIKNILLIYASIGLSRLSYKKGGASE